MNREYRYFFLLFYIIISSCSDAILKPLKGGKVYGSSNNKKNKIKYHPTETGTTIYLIPKKDLRVRAIEDCEILGIFSNKDSVKFIAAKGKINAGYGNLYKCFVSRGDHVFKGQIIGQLLPIDSLSDNSLSISLQKNGQPLIPKW